MKERTKSAFPYEFLKSPNGPEGEAGMSLRDYLAGQAVVGLSQDDDFYSSASWAEDMAEDAYEVADAMMEERKTEEASKNGNR